MRVAIARMTRRSAIVIRATDEYVRIIVTTAAPSSSESVTANNLGAPFMLEPGIARLAADQAHAPLVEVLAMQAQAPGAVGVDGCLARLLTGHIYPSL
jgi:hypothetical protein